MHHDLDLTTLERAMHVFEKSLDQNAVNSSEQVSYIMTWPNHVLHDTVLPLTESTIKIETLGGDHRAKIHISNMSPRIKPAPADETTFITKHILPGVKNAAFRITEPAVFRARDRIRTFMMAVAIAAYDNENIKKFNRDLKVFVSHSNQAWNRSVEFSFTDFNATLLTQERITAIGELADLLLENNATMPFRLLHNPSIQNLTNKRDSNGKQATTCRFEFRSAYSEFKMPAPLSTSSFLSAIRTLDKQLTGFGIADSRDIIDKITS